MKTFIVVLAAGAIIFAAFVGWQRLDRWEQAKVYWTAQFRQARDNMLREMPRDIMVNLSVDALTEAINRLDHATSVRTRAAHELRLYLENKPFRLPLFDEENRLLAESRKITGGTYAENRKVRIQSGLTPTPTPDTPTPALTDTPTPAPTDTPTPTPTPTDSKVADLAGAGPHRDGKRFIGKADDLLTAFLSLERDTIAAKGANGNATRQNVG